MATTSGQLPGIKLLGGWSEGEDGWADGVNSNWLALSVLTQACALDIITEVPFTPSEGDIYLLSSAASLNPNNIAVYHQAQWKYFAPSVGFRFFVQSKNAPYSYTKSGWTEDAGWAEDKKYVINNAGTSGGIVALDLDGDGTGRLTYQKADGSWEAVQPAGDYATQESSDSRYIQQATGENDFKPLLGGVNKTSKEMWFSYKDDSGNTNYAFAQVAGDYATNTALSDGLATKQPVGDYATNTALSDGLATKQPAGNYVKNNAGTQGGIIAIDLDGDGTGDLAFERADGSWGACQPQGDYANAIDVPVGCPQAWPLDTPPTGWLLLNGASFDKTQYPKLAIAFPSGVLPDMRGKFIRGWDNGANIDPNDGQTSPGSARELLSTQTDALQNIYGAFGNGYRGIIGVPGGAFTINATAYNGAIGRSIDWGGTGGVTNYNAANFDASLVARTSTETRPTNIAWNYIVRAA